MAKSEYVRAVDKFQRALRPLLADLGYKAKGRTFNRISADGLTQVVNIQMGPSMPPGTEFFPGLRNNMYGLFTINLGVHVPEVTDAIGYGEPKSWVQDYNCCIRARLGDVSGDIEDIWWHACFEEGILSNVRERLITGGLPWLQKHSTRDGILAELEGEDRVAGSPPRIVMAIILAKRGKRDRARELLREQIQGAHKGHADHVIGLAKKLHLGALMGPVE